MKRDASGRSALLLSSLVAFIAVFVAVRPLSADGPICVGIYQNEPLVFTDEEGHPSGFYVDLLEAMADEEGWDLEYVECLFPDCLALLEWGELDLMTAIAYSEERDQRFDFSHETVLANWAQVYVRKGGPQSILDLEGRTVAVVGEDIYYTRFRTLVEDFDISCQFIEVDEYGSVLKRVAAGEADAGLVARLYGLRHEGEYNVMRSPILCCPSELRFATPEGRNQSLLEAIDRHMTSWREDPDSIYYQALDRWFEGVVAKPTLRERVPAWIQWVVLAVGAVAVLVILFNLLLRAQVRARTRELREAETRYRGLFERVPIGLYSTTPEGEILEANPALANLLGYPDEQSMRGLNARDMYVDDEDRNRELARVDLEGEVRGYEMRMRRADGTPIWVRDHSRAIRDEQGRVVRYEGALEDISARKAAEKELKRSEALFRALAEEALVGVYLIQDGRFRYVNPALAAMFGYEPHEVIDRLGPLDLTAPEDRDLVAENVRRRIEGEVAHIHYTFRGLRKDGTTFDCEVLGGRVEYEGRPAVLGTLLDISERRRAEEARAARARRQAAVARLGLVALSEKDLDAFLDEAVSVVATTLGVELCRVLELLPAGEGLLLRAGVGWKEGVVGQAVVSADRRSYAGYTRLSRQPVVVEDLEKDDRFEVPPLLKEHGAVSGVSVIIGTPERPWGVLGVHSTRPRRFEREEVDFVQTAANVLAQFVARTAAEESVRRQTRRLEALRQIGLELAAELDLESLLRSIVERAVELIGGKFGGLDLYRPEQDVLEWTVAVGSLPPLPRATLRRGEGLSGKVWETGRPLVVEDYRRWEGRAAIFEGYPYAAMVAAPIRWGEEFLGVIHVGSDEPGVFTTADAELLDLFALQAAVAIRNAQQVADLAEERERLALLHRLGQRLSASLDIHAVAQQALDDICAVVGALRGVVCVWDPEVERLRPAAVSGYDAESVASLAERLQLPLGEGSLAGWVAATRQPVIVADVTADKRWLPVSGLDDWVRSALSVPLISRGELVGVMSVYSEREGFFGEDHRQLVESAAATVASAIANARLYEEEREQRRFAEALAEAAAAVSSTLDLDQVLDRILEQVEQVVPGDAFNIMLVENEHARVVRWRGYDEDSKKGRRFTTSPMPIAQYPALREMVETGGPVVVPDTATDSNWVREPDWEWIRSYVAAPIRVGGVTVGFLNVNGTHPGQFGTRHARRLAAFAGHIAIALENARLYGAAQKRAQQLTLVAQIARYIVSILEPNPLLQAVVEQIVEEFGYDYVTIMLLDSETEELVFATGAGVFAGRTPEGYRQKLKEGMIGWAAYLGETVLANDVSRESRYIPFIHETRSELDVPLKRGERVIGVLDIQSRQLNAFDAQDVQAMEALAGYIATAIENARLHAELRAYAEELEHRVEKRTAELRQERERIQAILDAAGEGVFVTNVQGRIEYMNPAAERITGYREEELRGQHLWVCAADEEQAERMRSMSQALASGEIWRGEVRLRRKDGAVYDAAIVVAPIPGEEGRLPGYVGVVEDVTPFRELDRLKSRFIRNISHEFRTPLATAKLYAELARRRPEHQEQHLAALDAELDRLAALVEDILEVARADAGQVVLQPRVTSLNDLVAPILERHRALAEGKGLCLEYRPADPSPVVKVDPGRMRRVVDNLLSNAIRYTPSGGQVVISTGTAQAEGRSWATVTVSDTGIGIPEDELPHIFERFFRGEEPRRMQISGTGLGLSIVKECTERHGGFVTVESEVGKGSTFTVWLPVVEAGS